MINREKFDAECRVAGVALKAYNVDGPQAGRATLADGTIVGHDGSLSHEVPGNVPAAASAAAYRALLAGHDPAPTPEQNAIERDHRESQALGARDPILTALTLHLWPAATAAERAWAAGVVAASGERLRKARGQPAAP